MDYMYANANNEECSSGCESGWTLYLEEEHSSVSPEPSYSKNRRFTAAKPSKEEREEDEDLSMVSDASSGPPHHEEADINNGCSDQCNADDSLSGVISRKENIIREKRRRNKPLDHSSLLDDTASSPFFDFSNKTRSPPLMENVLEYSQGYSTTQFEVRPPYQQHYDFFQPGNQMQQQQQQNQW